MKTVLAATITVILGITLLPVLISGGDSTPAVTPGVGVPVGPIPAGPLAVILATIRELESSGNYNARNSGSTASGAYQFLDSTWNNYNGYHRAVDAPPAVQDARAAEDVTNILNAHAGDVTAIPPSWYIGYLPAAGSPDWDTIPYPNEGNTITPRQYQTTWLKIYERRNADRATRLEP